MDGESDVDAAAIARSAGRRLRAERVADFSADPAVRVGMPLWPRCRFRRVGYAEPGDGSTGIDATAQRHMPAVSPARTKNGRCATNAMSMAPVLGRNLQGKFDEYLSSTESR